MNDHSMKIVIHCGNGGPDYPWGPHSLKQGIGGSEEAVINIARELTTLGHRVYVFCRGDKGSVLLSDGTWLNTEKHESRIAVTEADIFIAWRDWHLFDKAQDGAKKYLWCHDIPVEPHWNPAALDHFDKIILLNEYHRTRYGVAPERAFVCSNGVNLADFDGTEQSSVERIPGRCIYFSHPHRGLATLREYWPHIREAVPHATLASFWWQSEFFMPPDEALGILPMRALGHKELAREILSADLFTYPSVFNPEINPITCIKAQVGGAWPVTVNCGGMADTLLFGTVTDHEHFADEVIKQLKSETFGNEAPALRMMAQEVAREKMSAIGRQHFDWKHIAKQWEAEFQNTLHDRSFAYDRSSKEELAK